MKEMSAMYRYVAKGLGAFHLSTAVHQGVWGYCSLCTENTVNTERNFHPCLLNRGFAFDTKCNSSVADPGSLQA